MRSAVFMLLVIRLAFAGQHSLQYFHTLVSGVDNLPEFTAVGILADQEFMYFDSKTMKAVPKTEWISKNVEKKHWDMQTQIDIGHYEEYKDNMHSIMDLFNHSMSGVYTLQVMYGCELEDDNNNLGYYMFGYDGEDFISFDKNTLSWTAANPQSVNIKNKWDADTAKAAYWKAFLESECLTWMKMYVGYGKHILERKVAPQVSLLQKDSTSPVVCHATSFYPKNIMMTWKKNNEDHYEDVELSLTLPNEDGTYQKSISLSVKPEEWKKNPNEYRCVIQHVGAEKEIVVSLNENKINSNIDSNNIFVFVVGCVLALIVLASLTGIIMWKRSSRRYLNKLYVASENTESEKPMERYAESIL